MSINVNWQPGITLESMEKACILQALKFYRGNVTQTAISLGVCDKTIRNKLEIYEEDGKRQQERHEAQRAEQQRTLDRLRGIQPTQTSLPSARAGLHMESAPKVSTQQAVPVPERQEVQSVLPDASAEGRKRPGRPRLHKTDVGA